MHSGLKREWNGYTAKLLPRIEVVRRGIELLAIESDSTLLQRTDSKPGILDRCSCFKVVSKADTGSAGLGGTEFEISVVLDPLSTGLAAEKQHLRVVAEWEAKEAADASVVSVVNETKGGG